jgi:hypothetical protein
MNELKFSDLKTGMRVIDDEENIGIVKKHDDIHNIVVNYESGTGGYGFYCLDSSCDNGRYYDSLYKYEK